MSRLSSRSASRISSRNESNESLADFILNSSNPILVESRNDNEEIEVNGERGIQLNKSEEEAWSGDLPLSQYKINKDANPEVITKKTKQELEYIQEIAVRYLRPQTPAAPGDIIIEQECNIPSQPAPPLVIRQQPARPCTPKPLVIREEPPQLPAKLSCKLIRISGKRIPPPPRKVIIERLAQIPAKPQAILVERWLPYAETKRRVIFKRACQQDPVVLESRNVIVQWEAPKVTIKKEFKDLGVVRADPKDYAIRYAGKLIRSSSLPKFVRDIKAPEGLMLASKAQPKITHKLVGDLNALKLVDLDKEGLGEYKGQIQGLSRASSSKFSINSSLASSLSRSCASSLSSAQGAKSVSSIKSVISSQSSQKTALSLASSALSLRLSSLRAVSSQQLQTNQSRNSSAQSNQNASSNSSKNASRQSNNSNQSENGSLSRNASQGCDQNKQSRISTSQSRQNNSRQAGNQSRNSSSNKSNQQSNGFSQLNVNNSSLSQLSSRSSQNQTESNKSSNSQRSSQSSRNQSSQARKN
jgi:hypothetical protein